MVAVTATYRSCLLVLVQDNWPLGGLLGSLSPVPYYLCTQSRLSQPASALEFIQLYSEALYDCETAAIEGKTESFPETSHVWRGLAVFCFPVWSLEKNREGGPLPCPLVGDDM